MRKSAVRYDDQGNDWSNPFYQNYVFSKKDLERPTIKWWHYPLLLFRPMYVQIAEGYAVHFKTTADGRIFIFKMEKY